MTYSDIFTDLCYCIDNNLTTIVPNAFKDIPDNWSKNHDYSFSCTTTCGFCPHSSIHDRWCRYNGGATQRLLDDLQPIYPELFI